jgi:hypothetical protein
MSVIVWRRRTACLVSNELERVWKEAMVSPFRYGWPEAGMLTVDRYVPLQAVIPHGNCIVGCTAVVLFPQIRKLLAMSIHNSGQSSCFMYLPAHS